MAVGPVQRAFGLAAFVVVTLGLAGTWTAAHWKDLTGPPPAVTKAVDVSKGGGVKVQTLPAEEQRPPRIAVTPRGYDDMGAILRSLGEGYPFKTLPLETILQGNLLERCDVLFINCSAVPPAFVRGGADLGGTSRPGTRKKRLPQHVADKIRVNLRDFVEKGGSLYTSDWAAGFLMPAFPEYLQFGQHRGPRGKVTAEVTDKELWPRLGRSVQLHFDKAGWIPVKSVSRDAKVHLIGSYPRGRDGMTETRPLLVSFRHGKGTVVYTTFHNEKQVSEKERRLLEYLALKPITAQVLRTMRTVSIKERFSVAKENVFTTGGSTPEREYAFDAPGGADLRFGMSWQAAGAVDFEIVLVAPDGKPARTLRVSKAPVVMSVPKAAKGTWRFRVRAHKVPFRDFPYAIQVGVRQ